MLHFSLFQLFFGLCLCLGMGALAANPQPTDPPRPGGLNRSQSAQRRRPPVDAVPSPAEGGALTPVSAARLQALRFKEASQPSESPSPQSPEQPTLEGRKKKWRPGSPYSQRGRSGSEGNTLLPYSGNLAQWAPSTGVAEYSPALTSPGEPASSNLPIPEHLDRAYSPGLTPVIPPALSRTTLQQAPSAAPAKEPTEGVFISLETALARLNIPDADALPVYLGNGVWEDDSWSSSGAEDDAHLWQDTDSETLDETTLWADSDPTRPEEAEIPLRDYFPQQTNEYTDPHPLTALRSTPAGGPIDQPSRPSPSPLHYRSWEELDQASAPTDYAAQTNRTTPPPPEYAGIQIAIEDYAKTPPEPWRLGGLEDLRLLVAYQKNYPGGPRGSLPPSLGMILLRAQGIKDWGFLDGLPNLRYLYVPDLQHVPPAVAQRFQLCLLEPGQPEDMATIAAALGPQTQQPRLVSQMSVLVQAAVEDDPELAEFLLEYFNYAELRNRSRGV